VECIALDQEIESMLEKGAIERVKPEPDQVVSFLFLRKKKDGSFRPIFNLKAVNNHVLYQHFKMEGIHLALDMVQRQEFFVKLDLKDAYFTINMDVTERKYLKFQWKNQLHQFVSCPFGLASAPWTFTKFLKPVMAILRKIGMKVIVYLDDMLLMHQDPIILQKQLTTAIWLLQRLGFLINWEKSQIHPQQNMDPGVCPRLGQNASLSTRSESAQHSRGVQLSFTSEVSIGETVVSVDRQARGSCESSVTGTTALQTAANAKIKGFVDESSELRVGSFLDKRMQSGASLVESGASELERTKFHQAMSGPSAPHDDGCVKIRLGSNMQWCPHSGIVVNRRESVTHQCSGNEGSNVRSEIIHQRHIQQTHSCESKLYDYGGQYQQDGHHQIRSDASSH
jgi:hypothetical protein